MTSTRRFEQDLPALLDDLYVAGMPDYRDDLVAQIARTPQRPAWTLPERWLPMDVATRRLPVLPVPWRTLVVLALVIVLAAAAVLVVVGSRQRVPAPFGPAGNGEIGYSSNGDIYVRDTLDGAPRLAVSGPGDDGFPTYSPDGTHFLFSTTAAGGNEWLKVANADGSNPIQVFERPLIDASTAWSPDSRSIALISDLMGFPVLYLVQADGSGSTAVGLGLLVPSEVTWRPPVGETLLIRATGAAGTVDLYSVRPDGTQLRAFHLPSPLLMGDHWDVTGAAWSPTGDLIAYNSVERDPATGFNHFRVHLVKPDGTGDRAVAPPSDTNVHEAWPHFSPDGRWIVVHRWTWSTDVGGTPDAAGWLAVMPADGRVAAHDVGPKIPGGEHTGLTDSWSPDGTRILLRADNTHSVYSIDPATGEVTPLPWAGFDLPDIRRVAP